MAEMGERTAAGRKFRPTPAPAIIDGVEWKVRESPADRVAYVDFEKKTMVVPMSETAVGNMIRAHETTHVAITPQKEFLNAHARGLNMRSLNAAEDCRVYSAMRKAGVDCSASHWPDGDIVTVQRSSELEQLRTLVAVRGTGDEPKIAAVVSDKVKRAASELVAKYFEPFEARGELPPFSSAIGMAEDFKAALEDDEDEGDSSPEGMSSPESTGSGTGDGAPSDSESEEDDDDNDSESDEVDDGDDDSGESEDETLPDPEDDEMGQPFRTVNSKIDKKVLRHFPTPAESERIKRHLGYRMAGAIDDGVLITNPEAMEIVRPKLTAKLPSLKLEGYRKRSSDMGAVPRNMHRRTIDNAVFQSKIRRGTASILFDISGSMAISPEEIMAVIKKVPSAIVATYSGVSGEGILTIVAENGRCISQMSPSYQLGGNVVDYLALQWLARQKAPRYWICDGLVTGERDHLLDLDGCMEIVKVVESANIKRIESWQDLMETGQFKFANDPTFRG